MTSETTTPEPRRKVMTADRMPVAVALDRILTPEERARFQTEFLSAGPYQGAEPADWIEEAADADAYLGVIEEWMDANNETYMPQLLMYLPADVARALLWRAVYAWLPVLQGSPPAGGARNPGELALDAATWLRGYAEGRGYEVQA